MQWSFGNTSLSSIDMWVNGVSIALASGDEDMHNICREPYWKSERVVGGATGMAVS